MYWTKEKIILVLKLLSINEPISQKIINKYHKQGLICDVTTIYRKFNSIEKLCKEANVLFKEKKWSKQNIIKALQSIPKNIPITTKNLIKISKQNKLCNLSEIYNNFNSIENVCKEANIRCDIIKKDWTKEKIINGLKQLSKNGIITTKLLSEGRKKGIICDTNIINKNFGTLQNAYKNANVLYSKKEKWPKEKILNTLRQLYNEKGKFTKGDIKRFHNEGKICGDSVIIQKFNSLEQAAEQAGIEFFKQREIRWKIKEDFGLELCKELYGEGQIKPYYKTKFGRAFPDYVPLNLIHPIIDIKSTPINCSIQQQDKYETIRKDVRCMVFENKGITNFPSDRIIHMTEIIKTLPNNKKIIFQEKYERIKNNIPSIQQKIQTFI